MFSPKSVSVCLLGIILIIMDFDDISAIVPRMITKTA